MGKTVRLTGLVWGDGVSSDGCLILRNEARRILVAVRLPVPPSVANEALRPYLGKEATVEGRVVGNRVMRKDGAKWRCYVVDAERLL